MLDIGTSLLATDYQIVGGVTGPSMRTGDDTTHVIGVYQTAANFQMVRKGQAGIPHRPYLDDFEH